MHHATLLLLASAPIAVVAIDEERLLDMATRAVGFSPWGAAVVWIAWTGRRDIVKALDTLAALWRETLDIVKPWADRSRELTEAIRESSPGVTHDKPPPRRPRTNPVNLPPKRQ